MSDSHLLLAQALTHELRLPERVVGMEFLGKGFSTDRKYVLSSERGPEYLLRVSDLAEEPRRRQDCEMLARLSGAGVACPRPLHFGTRPEQGLCFMVVTYLPGEGADEALPALTPVQQHEIGLQAGVELAKIHRALSPPAPVDDYAVWSGKHARNRSRVQELGITFHGQDQAERYVAAHLHLLRDRPTVLRHGDYHPGNLVVQGGAFVGVVDFNRCDWGDPVDEFYKLAFFGAPVSEEYARGQLLGYFGGPPPGEFWPIYNLYVAMALSGDIAWTERNWPQYLPRSLELIEVIARTHDFEDGRPPEWWRGGPSR